MIVSPLSDHRRFIPLLADAFAAEWPDWCARVGREAVEAIFADGAAGRLPVNLVAHAGGELCGTVALRAWFAEAPMPETPWVRQLYVLPAHRGLGVDRALGVAVEQHARRLGFTRLHAATDRIERLLVRRGWEVWRRVEHEGRPMAWLRKEITCC